MGPEAAYAELLQRSREQSMFSSCAELLAWDEETYLPRAGVAHRSEQLALLTSELHGRATDPRIAELLVAIDGSALVRDPESRAAANVREIRRAYDRETRVPLELAQELARVTSLAHQEWVGARKTDDFARFRPWLERIVKLRREEAAAVGFAEVPYDALLDDYEPGVTTQAMAVIYDAIRADLVPLAAAVMDAARQPDHRLLRGDYPAAQQHTLVETVLEAVGFDFRGGRLDTSVHPFSTHIGPGDCRLTTRYDPRDVTDGLMSVLHEAGHGLYDQGLDAEHFGTPVGQANSHGLHESQARLWENRVGRSRAFWDYVVPVARKMFPNAWHGASAEDVQFAVNRVSRSVNRTRADELTYNLHTLIRFELELALIGGDLAIADLPTAWNDLSLRYLGVVPADDAEGCLQDSHWAAGLIGYFPTYTLGDVIAAQLFVTAEQEVGNLDECFARGQFSVLRDWLRERVHRHGMRYPTSALIARVTGEPPDHRVLVALLREKYRGLYGIRD